MTVNLSAANQSYIEKASVAQQTTTNPMVSSENTSETKTIDKKKLACSIGAALGVVALAATVIHFVKKGNAKGAKEAVDAAGKAGKQAAEAVNENVSKKASEVSTQFEKGIKKFFNGETLVDGVKLEKGKALNADGSAFSGVMKTMSKDGSTVAIEYTDGFVKSSTKNGKLIKTFDDFGQGLTRNQGVHITKYLEDGKTQDIYETFYDSGKLKKIIRPDEYNFDGEKYKAFRAKQYNKQGNLTAETVIAHNENKLYSGNFFDEDGILESTIVTNRYGNLEKSVYSKDGTLVKKCSCGIMKPGKEIAIDNISANDYIQPRYVTTFTQKGKMAKYYAVTNEDANIKINLNDFAEDDSVWGLCLPMREKLNPRDCQSEDIFKIINSDGSISLTKDGIKTEGKIISKKDIEKMIEKAKEILGVAKDNGLMDCAFSEAQDVGLGEFANLKRYENLIQQLEESAKKL